MEEPRIFGDDPRHTTLIEQGLGHEVPSFDTNLPVTKPCLSNQLEDSVRHHIVCCLVSGLQSRIHEQPPSKIEHGDITEINV